MKLTPKEEKILARAQKAVKQELVAALKEVKQNAKDNGLSPKETATIRKLAMKEFLDSYR